MISIWTVLAFLIAAMVLLALEILTPTFGVLIAAAIGFLVGAVWVMFTISTVAGFVLLISLFVFVPAYLVVLVRFLPKSPLGRRLFLGRGGTGGKAQGTPKAEALAALVGKTGESLTPLRPVGSVRIDGRRYGAVAEGEMIGADVRIKVIASHGSEVVVRETDQP